MVLIDIFQVQGTPGTFNVLFSHVLAVQAAG